MTFYATMKHHSKVGYWEKLNAKTILGAKREASKRYSGDLPDGVIHVIEAKTDHDEEWINDLPAWSKQVISKKWLPPAY